MERLGVMGSERSQRTIGAEQSVGRAGNPAPNLPQEMPRLSIIRLEHMAVPDDISSRANVDGLRTIHS